MERRLEYESVRSSLLNKSPAHSLYIYFGELLREERLSTQAILEQSHAVSRQQVWFMLPKDMDHL